MPRLERHNYTFVMIKPCAKAILKLNKQRPSPILAAMDGFADMWRKDTRDDVLIARYDFKPIGSDQRCRQEGHVFQVRLLGGRYRALVTFVDTKRTCYWLDVFIKNPTDQDNHIRTACDRALRLQEREP